MSRACCDTRREMLFQHEACPAPMPVTLLIW